MHSSIQILFKDDINYKMPDFGIRYHESFLFTQQQPKADT